MEDFGLLLSRISKLELSQLREQWFLHYRGGAGKGMGATLLRQAIAYRLQELECDAAGRCKAIRKMAEKYPRTREANGHGYAQHMKPGTRFLREYKGKVHEVLAVRNGLFVYEGQIYRSLSEVARRIIGKPRGGTTFFGLKGERREDPRG